eukprot:570450-Rhodomonas_salina.1
MSMASLLRKVSSARKRLRSDEVLSSGPTSGICGSTPQGSSASSAKLGWNGAVVLSLRTEKEREWLQRRAAEGERCRVPAQLSKITSRMNDRQRRAGEVRRREARSCLPLRVRETSPSCPRSPCQPVRR